MKRLILITTILLSPSLMAKNDAERASEAIEKVLKMKIEDKVIKPLQNGLKIRADKFIRMNTSNGKPNDTLKGVGTFLKVVKEVVEPSVIITTEDTKLQIKLLQFKNLKLDYTNTNNDLKLQFETDLNKTTLDLKMNF